MASITLTQMIPLFGSGTTVSAYLPSQWPLGVLTGAPTGTAAATGVVQTDGSLTFAGLNADSEYVAYANVAGTDKYTRFRVGAGGLSTAAKDVEIIEARLPSYTAIYRLAARPYALSFAHTLNTRKQFATIHHAANATKLVKLRHVFVALESASVAGLFVADLHRITTAPATGNPAITPTPHSPGDAAAEATCLALPTTAGTEGALVAMQEFNLGITGAGSAVNPPPGLTMYDLLAPAPVRTPDSRLKIPEIRPGVLEGWAVTIDASATSTVKGFVIVEFTEE